MKDGQMEGSRIWGQEAAGTERMDRGLNICLFTDGKKGGRAHG